MVSFEKAPLHIVIVLGIFSWTFTHIIDTITERPIISYEISSTRTDDILTSTYTFKNISKKILINNLELQFIAGTDSILAKNYDVNPPLILDSNSIESHVNHLKLKIVEFQPNCSLSVTIQKRGVEIPIRYRTGNTSYLLPNTDYQCRFLYYEMYVYSFLLLIGVLVLVANGIWLFASFYRSRSESKKKSNCGVNDRTTGKKVGTVHFTLLLLLMVFWNDNSYGQICFRAIDQCREGVKCDVNVTNEKGECFNGKTDEKGFFFNKDLVAGSRISVSAFDPLQFNTPKISTSDTSVYTINFEDKYKKCTQQNEYENVALVIANATEMSADEKVVCQNDARNVAATLRACKFSVTMSENENEVELLRKINSFIINAKFAKLIFVYFSGYCFAYRTSLYITSRRLGVKERGHVSMNYIIDNLDASTSVNSDKIFFLQSYFNTNDCSLNSIINIRTRLDQSLFYTSKNYVFIPSIGKADSNFSTPTYHFMKSIRSASDTTETLEEKYWLVDTALGRYITNSLTGKKQEIARQKYFHFGRKVKLNFYEKKYQDPTIVTPQAKKIDNVTISKSNVPIKNKTNESHGVNDFNSKPEDRVVNDKNTEEEQQALVSDALSGVYDSSGVNLIKTPYVYDEERINIREIKYMEIDYNDTQNVLCHFGTIDEGFDQQDLDYQKLQRNQLQVLSKRNSSIQLNALEYAILGDYYLDNNDIPMSKKMYLISIRADSNRYALLGLAHISYYDHNLQESIMFCNMAIAHGNNKAYAFLGELYFSVGKDVHSRVSLEQALNYGVKYINYQQLSLLAYFYNNGVGGSKDYEKYKEMRIILNNCYK